MTAATTTTRSRAATLPPPSGADLLVSAAEALIIKGKDHGYLTPDDILAAFPEIDVEPDHLERIFHVFREMGIEVSDGDKDFETVDEIDEELIAKAEAIELGLPRRPGPDVPQGDRPCRAPQGRAGGPLRQAHRAGR